MEYVQPNQGLAPRFTPAVETCHDTEFIAMQGPSKKVRSRECCERVKRKFRCASRGCREDSTVPSGANGLPERAPAAESENGDLSTGT